MISTTRIIRTDSTKPTHNLALEEYLTVNVKEDDIILFLWQNANTVVIGRNQNCWAECLTDKMDADGVTLVRRLSGGGAVYHDLGNLNFTFITREENYDVDRQLGVIIEALKSLGITAEKTGRNDITVEGRKFSGNAFYKSDKGWYHHGTLMVDVDKQKLSEYLNVSKAKLESKGVKSVKSRVANLREFRDDLTIDMLSDALQEAFAKEYDCEAVFFTEEELDSGEIAKLQERYTSWDWTYGRKIPFSTEVEHRFDWGGVDLKLDVSEGVIRDVVCYSDAMDQDLAEKVEKQLKGKSFMQGDAFWLEFDNMVKRIK